MCLSSITAYLLRPGTKTQLHQRCNEDTNKEAADKEWNKRQNLLAWHFKNVLPKAEVVRQAKNDVRYVQFASLVDLCHLKHAELAKHFPKCKGRVMLGRENVKDDNGYREVFAEQGALALEKKRHTLWIQLPDILVVWQGNRMTQYPRTFKAHVGRSQIAEIVGDKMPTSMDMDTTITQPKMVTDHTHHNTPHRERAAARSGTLRRTCAVQNSLGQ